jgi:hypothetical protein
MKNLSFLTLLIVLVSSCAVGPKIRYSDNYDNFTKVKADKVIIPYFTLQKKLISNQLNGTYYDATNNATVYNFKVTTQIGTGNISLNLVNYFENNGIQAESYSKIDITKLNNKDYIFFGSASISPAYKAPWEVFAFFTVVPLVLPMPFTSNYGVNVAYEYQLMDKHGNFISQEQDKFKVLFGSHYLPAGVFRSGNIPSFVYDAAELELYKVLANKFDN